MPRRTNEFQQLVALIQRALAPRGAKITESAMVDVAGSGEQREIDILIESEVGPYTIKIAVEAKDERRKMDSTRFESILGKYIVEGGIKVDKVVLITHRGFYQPVIDRAKRLGILLFTLKQAKTVNWSTLLPTKLQLRMSPHICGIEFTPSITSEIIHRVIKESAICCSHGTNHGPPAAFIKNRCLPGILRLRPDLPSELKQFALTHSGQAKANVVFTPDHPHFIRFEGRDFPLGSLRFCIHLVNGVGHMSYTTCQLHSTDGSTTDLAMGEVKVAGKRIQLMIPDGLESSQIILHIGDVQP